jgi:hypothetical protein
LIDREKEVEVVRCKDAEIPVVPVLENCLGGATLDRVY